MTAFARFAEAGGTVGFGTLEDDRITVIAGEPWVDPTPTGRTVDLVDVRLLAPNRPGFAIGVGLNYGATIGDREPSDEPGMFLKPTADVIGPNDEIVLPAGGVNAIPEGEIVAVIGRDIHRAGHAEARAAVFGVTAGNDVTARRWLASPGDWWRAKGSSTFTAVGPVIATGLDLDDLELVTRVNGVEASRGNSGNLVLGIPALVAYVSQHVPLHAGDWIFTGTPARLPNLEPGDLVEVEIGGVGVLRNTVAPR